MIVMKQSAFLQTFHLECFFTESAYMMIICLSIALIYVALNRGIAVFNNNLSI